jgi:DNA-binding NtrC family response regulator
MISWKSQAAEPMNPPNASKPPPELPFLVVSYDGDLRLWLRELLESWSVDVVDVPDLPLAVRRLLLSGPFGAVVCDEDLPGGSATGLMRLASSQGINLPFVVTAKALPPHAAHTGRIKFVTKPLRPSELWDALDELLDGGLTAFHRRLDAEDSVSWNARVRQDLARRARTGLQAAIAQPA